MVAFVLRSLACEAAILLGTFLAAWAAAFAAIYWLAGGQAGIIQGWGLILILVPTVAAAFAVKLVGALRMKRRGNELVRALLLRAKDHPMFHACHRKLAARGLRICLNCGDFSLSPLARSCAACNSPFAPLMPESGSTDLRDVHAGGTDLRDVHAEGTEPREVHSGGANLREVLAPHIPQAGHGPGASDRAARHSRIRSLS